MQKVTLRLGEANITKSGFLQLSSMVLFAGVLHDDLVTLVVVHGSASSAAMSYNLFLKVGQTAFIDFEKNQKTVKVLEIIKSGTEVSLTFSEIE